MSAPPRPSSILSRLLVGGEALAQREAATTQRLDAAERLRALCEGQPCPPEPESPEKEQAAG